MTFKIAGTRSGRTELEQSNAVIVERRVLVVGQSDVDGASVWSDGPLARRLWTWFGCDSLEEFLSVADPVNVARCYERGVGGKSDSFVVDLMAKREILSVVSKYSLVILVGRVAQREIFGSLPPRKNLWRVGNLVGVPHPSGLNRRTNHGGTDAARDFVRAAMRGVTT